MEKKPQELIVEADPVFLCLARCPGDADDDISKRTGMPGRADAVMHWEGKHIGRPVYAAIKGIEAPHPVTAYE